MATQQQPQPPTSLTRNAPAPVEPARQRPTVAPDVDVHENDSEVLVLADLPGVTRDNLHIHFEKGRLTIEGQRTAPQWPAVLAETTVANFRRTFLVPQGIAADKISAELSQGVLQVHLPKHESLRPRRIEVKPS